MIFHTVATTLKIKRGEIKSVNSMHTAGESKRISHEKWREESWLPVSSVLLFMNDES